MICWKESVSPVADLCLTNQIYSVLLNAFEFKEITEVQNPHLKMLLDDITRPRSCKYPTPPWTLAKILPDTTMRAYFRQIEIASSITDTFLTLSTNLLYPCMYVCMYVYTRGILGCLLGFRRSWPLGQTPAGAVNNY